MKEKFMMTREQLEWFGEYLTKCINDDDSISRITGHILVEDLPKDYQKVLMAYTVDKIHELNAQGG
tara:strand:- start:6616 stop:6813 length:198 start_codon:yes stop_codon:yes gene_type:complete